MRWEPLFADLEAQLRMQTAEEADVLRADEERSRIAALSLRDRLMRAAAQGELRVRTRAGTVLQVVPERFGRNWLSAMSGGRQPRPVILPLHAVVGVITAPEDAAQTAHAAQSLSNGIADRIDIGVILRELCRRRLTIELTTLTTTIAGTIDRVGADHLDLAVHDPASPRRQDAVRSLEMVPFWAIDLVAC